MRLIAAVGSQEMQKEGVGFVLLRGCRCARCAHEWLPRRKTEKPTICPKCKSPYWDKPKAVSRPRSTSKKK